ncbi:Lrp/AsnC family transcriptional regulator [Mycobacterium sp. AT1]|uniref:Lrp/AsnC family transcriptional regulator n=1 Tax=Mycobacterium sp. AT1 TaxID=1961706 RepID=UPI0009C975D3|nr:Lrp/AsnC family transcriptional regulator [Mycobacterium sp. AT1]OPX09845.1 hypothetical protein B1790_13960 [Mycobacterium sp. AT1]
MGLDELDRRIVGALQVDGRASWRRIAEVLDVPFTTVTRRGAALLGSGAVRVVTLPRHSQTAIIEVTVAPQCFEGVARALAERADTVFVFALSAPARIIIEELQPSDGMLAKAVLDEIPAIGGVTGVDAAPILAYYRTLSTWMPALLTPEEVMELNPKFGRLYDDAIPLATAADHELYDILATDGRVSVADIAARVGQSESAVRRRLAGLVDTKVDVRAVVSPKLLGLGVAAILWIRVAPGDVDRVAGQLLQSPYVRYAAMTMGDHQLIVDVAVPTLDDLRRFLTEQPWNAAVESIRSSPVLKTYKRSGLAVDECN